MRSELWWIIFATAHFQFLHLCYRLIYNWQFGIAVYSVLMKSISRQKVNFSL